MENDMFDNKEAIGQQLFITWAQSNPNIKKYEFSPKGSAEDVRLNSGGTYYVSEIKVRSDCDLKTAIKYGPFVEKPKWYSIKRKKEKIERTKNIKINILYINFFKDGALIFELKDIKNQNWKWEMLPESYDDRTLVEKEVCALFNPIEIIYGK